jgi:energy-coupling factor transporter ATP-binding protein EcfA2
LDHYELNSLSDGEFQLLTIYALIDLFDEDNTLYLLDEMDSHLYFENVRKLWSTFSDIKGKLITTTHSADSIIQNDFSSLKLVQNGKVESDTIANSVLERLEALSSGENYKYYLAGKVNYLVLVEDFSDWFIFRELARKKVENFNEDLIQNIHYIKCSSGYHHAGEIFGNTKLNWIEKFKESNTTHLTKSIYLICDRDNLSIEDVRDTGLVQNAKNIDRNNQIQLSENGKHAYLMSWRRREIENYLLSYTMLDNHGLLEAMNDRLGRINQLRTDDPADNNQVRNLDVKKIIQPLYQKDNISELDTSARGIDFDKLKNIIDEIPASEISEDIENLYNFIVQKS